MEALLTEIIDALSDKQIDLGLSLVDEDYGQLEALDTDTDTYPLTSPAVLVSIDSVDWQDEGGLNQIGKATISAKLIIDCYDDTHMGSNTTDKVKERMQLNRDVTEVLHGLRILDNKAKLTRISSQFYTATHGIKVYQSTYSAEVIEGFPQYSKYLI